MNKVKYGRILSCALFGIEGVLVEIEVSLLPGMPHFEIVGLGDSAVKESRNRVYAAIKNSGFNFPQGKLTASYAPAWLKKEGTSFDLALALAILIASGQLSQKRSDWLPCVFGELSLKGQVKPLPGVICRAVACLENGIEEMIVPADNWLEADSVDACKPIPASSLSEAVKILALDKKYCLELVAKKHIMHTANCEQEDELAGNSSEIETINFAGQKRAVRGLTLAAAGWHHSLLMGSAGCGKTTLAQIMPYLLPPIDNQEALMITRIHSAAGRLAQNSGLIKERKFYAPHHSITRAALTGGGRFPSPGLCSLAHSGVLFLDEMTEFSAVVLDSLRQPLENKVVNISRLNNQVTWPADFLMIGAANPCQCGEYLEKDSACNCNAEQIKRHLGKISGPLMDRMDITIEMTRLKGDELPDSVSGKNSTLVIWQMKKDIEKCWRIQKQRTREYGISEQLNSRVKSDDISGLFKFSNEILKFTASSAETLRLSARGYIKVLKLARTIADLQNEEQVKTEHVAEAFQYRLQRPVV